MTTINYYGNIYQTSEPAINYNTLKEIFEKGQTQEIENLKNKIAELERQLREKDEIIQNITIPATSGARNEIIPQNEIVQKTSNIFFGVAMKFQVSILT
jgi:hypothetical protein